LHLYRTLVAHSTIVSNLTSIPAPPFHIVVAGGCHVYGWPIGDSSSFIRVVLSSAPPATLSTLAPVNLRNCTALIPLIRRQPADVVILQLGNYETLASIKKHLRAVLRFSRSAQSRQESDTGIQLEPDTDFQSTPTWRRRVLYKQIYSKSLGQMSPPLFDSEAFRLRYTQVLTELQSETHAPRLIVALSPIPCADHLIRHYRYQAAEILRQVCSDLPPHPTSRVHYLDSAQALGIDGRNTELLAAGIFADDLHLNRRGHLLLGNALASVLQQNLWVALTEAQSTSTI
jgi:lysophospholipase L1-like esterase